MPAATRRCLGRPPGRASAAAAFTLVESLAAMAVLAMVAAAVTTAIVAGQQQGLETLQTVRRTQLAVALLEEVLSRAYADPQGGGAAGPEAGEAKRLGWDNLDDYHDLEELPNQIKDAQGLAYPAAMQIFRRAVTVTADSRTLGAGPIVPGLNVVVTVEDDHGGRTVVSRFVPEPAP